MKRSELDILLHRREVLARKIEAYVKVRRAISDLASQFLHDVYALEALNSIDKTLFQWILYMQQGLKKLEEKIERFQSAQFSE